MFISSIFIIVVSRNLESGIFLCLSSRGQNIVVIVSVCMYVCIFLSPSILFSFTDLLDKYREHIVEFCVFSHKNALFTVCFRCRGKDATEGDIVTFVASAENTGDIQEYISQVVRSISGQAASPSSHLPTVVVVDNLQHVVSLADVFRTFLSAKPASWFVVFTDH